MHELRMRERVPVRPRLRLLNTMSTTYDVVETLVGNHRRFLSFLEKRVESREAAEDILHDAFIRGLDSQSLREADSAVAWFYRALHNAVIDHYRRRAAEARALDVLPPAEENELREAGWACVAELITTLQSELVSASQRVQCAWP